MLNRTPIKQLNNIEPIDLKTLSDNSSPPVIHIYDKESLRGSQTLVLEPKEMLRIESDYSNCQIDDVKTPHLFESEGRQTQQHAMPFDFFMEHRRSIQDSSPTKNKHLFPKYEPHSQMRKYDNTSSKFVSEKKKKPTAAPDYHFIL